MASSADAVAVPQLNGLADPSSQSQPQSDHDHSQPADPSAKRKREATDDGSAEPSTNGNGNGSTHDHDPDPDPDHASDRGDDDAKEAKPVVNGDQVLRDESSLIRDYFNVLQRYAHARSRPHTSTSHHSPSFPSIPLLQLHSSCCRATRPHLQPACLPTMSGTTQRPPS